MTTPYINTTIAQANAKSSGVCIFLYLLFGLVGAHRYYIKGITVFNILYTLTIGFFGIMFFIDFFLVWGMAGKCNSSALEKAFIKDFAMREGARNANGN
ncbi:hypothetical protein [Vibrio phage PH669]|uniref:TM2 domain-containing protein n=1 Tax=Vibrio phage PH669 TaxID=2800823 RepID=A0A7T7CLA6_9CAUD|nr:hypothetical protein [Vibrio phage PH669]